MKPLRIALILALAVALMTGAGCSDKETAAKVNGEKITIVELDKQVEQLKTQYPDMFTGADGEGRLIDFKQRLLDNLINQKLIEQAAKDKKISISEDEIAKQIEQLKSGFQDDKQFQDALKSAGMTEESLTTQIREQLLTQKLIESLSKDAKVSEVDIKSYYDKNKSQFEQQAAKRASHILFKPEDKQEAERVLSQVRSGGNFSALAKEYSVDTATATNGGDLGWPTTPYVPEFEAALKKLDKGQTSALVKTPYGWHIIRVTEERSASQQKLEDVKDQIEQILVQQNRADAYQKFLDALRKKAKIEILLEELRTVSPASQETTAK
ncbi:MAG: SurA N-terminal domain-containing protein [Coriobacteriia bacterium]|nr:SurA N-terminal domain-containing protein [Coriobacteriia bacterium]